jgi:spermidine synthase
MGLPMKRPELLASTITPDGMRMTLSLHAGDYYIEVDGQALMSTRAPGSEKALADLAARELGGHSHPRVLIGGLGLGFTLGAALDALPRGASVVVAEYFETIVDWNRKFGFQSEIDRLADPRVTVEVTDVVDYLRDVKEPFDAILLDVDNGPDAWCLESNNRLYDRPGLMRIRRALKPGGLLAVWSAAASSAFEKRLVEVGFAARSEAVRSRGHKGERHTIFLGRVPGNGRR